jgi:acyl transferase domain-containing protein
MTASMSVAVLSMATRLPGASDDVALATLLERGGDATNTPPVDRWALQARWLPASLQDVARNCRGGFLEGAFDFDARLFGVSPREARLMDPQQRIFLEMAWQACDEAGYGGPSIVGSRTGVFAGTSRADYFEQIAGHLVTEDYLAGLANSHAVLANRVSSFFDLRGPSLTVDTLCSSSLVAVHLAIESLRGGTCDMAIAGGINFLMSARYLFALRGLRLLSPTGHCRPFRHEADGFVPAEGGVVLLLKRLPDALHDRDPVRAVIVGSSLMHHGASRGLTVPSDGTMAAVMQAALLDADMPASRVSCVQAMGASNGLGDAAELAALARVYGMASGRGPALRISCEKGTLGHVEAASGVASLASAVLSLERSIHFPAAAQGRLTADLATRGLRVLETSEPYADDGESYVGVSSFGMTGTYVHLVVRGAASAWQEARVGIGWRVLVISGESEAALNASMQAYRESLEAVPAVPLDDFLFTAAVGRWHGRFRAAVVALSRDEFVGALRDLMSGREGVRAGASAFLGQIKGRPPLQGAASAGAVLLSGQTMARDACEVAAQRFIAGLQVDWNALNPGARRRVRIPTTIFQRQTFRFDPPTNPDLAPVAPASQPLSHAHPMLQGARRK